MTDFRIGAGRNFVAPDGIVGHPNGNMYVTTDDLGLAQLSPAGVVTEFALPTANSDPVDIAVGADDVVYLVSRRTKAVTRFDPITKDVLEIAITNGNTPTDIITVPGASAEKTELVINAYNASFDFTPQKLTVEKTDTPPDDPPALTIEKYPPSQGVELDDRNEQAFRIGSAISFHLVLTNNSKTVPAGGWTIRDFIPAGLEDCFATPSFAPLPVVIEKVAGFIKITPKGDAILPPQGKVHLLIYCRVAGTGLITNIADVTAPGMTPARGSAGIVGLTPREMQRLEEQRARTDVPGRP